MKKNIVYPLMIALAVFGVIGWSLVLNQGKEAQALTQSSTIVDGEMLDSLYSAVFHRPVDASGRGFHLGRELKTVLQDFNNSYEMRYYGALFKAVKSYEEAQRAPGTLTDAEKQSHLDLINSALSNLLAWVSTLPDQDPCRASIRSDEAKLAVIEGYNGLTSSLRATAQVSALDSSSSPRLIGSPIDMTIYSKCPPVVSPLPTPPVACTMEAKQCPNGSWVGRTGPSCQFASCPSGPVVSPYPTPPAN